ncbi:MAG: hypothetical protein LBE51_20960 [Acidovorax sp.]|nr:hypothetical protein [Acidovorax sp.]
MSPAEIRWRCERLAVLLARASRVEALVTVATEARTQPWLDDPRPPPPSIPSGSYWGA